MSDVGARVEWLTVEGDPDVWRSIGLSVTSDGLVPLFGTCLRIVSPDDSTDDSTDVAPDEAEAEPAVRGSGIVGWSLSGITKTTSIAGLTTSVIDAQQPVYAQHALGAQALDHVVVMTGDLDDTTSQIAAATGCELKRVREIGKITQGFHRIGRGGLIVEVVHHEDDERVSPEFWGLVINVDDLDAACAVIGDGRIGTPKDAVQPGRRIATVSGEVGLGLPVALMSV